jgi:hypothetical protein
MAARLLNLSEIEVVVLSVDAGVSPASFAFCHALETATQSALPLTTSERRSAAKRLIHERPDLSHREIARLVGVSHDSVDRWATGVADSASNDPEPSSASRLPTADEAARRLVGFLTKLDESRGLLDYLAGSRMGRHMAEAFEDRLGENALTEARKFAKWTALAVQTLEERS